MRSLLTLAICASLLSSLSACSGNSKMKKLSNSELAAKQDECIRKNPTSPGRVTACENIRKECERRREEGNYAC